MCLTAGNVFPLLQSHIYTDPSLLFGTVSQSYHFIWFWPTSWRLSGLPFSQVEVSADLVAQPSVNSLRLYNFVLEKAGWRHRLPNALCTLEGSYWLMLQRYILKSTNLQIWFDIRLAQYWTGRIQFLFAHLWCLSFPRGSDGKESACNAGGWEDPLEEGMATHCSILAWEIPMDRGAWQAAVYRILKGRTRLSDWAHKWCRKKRLHTI